MCCSILVSKNRKLQVGEQKSIFIPRNWNSTARKRQHKFVQQWQADDIQADDNINLCNSDWQKDEEVQMPSTQRRSQLLMINYLKLIKNTSIKCHKTVWQMVHDMLADDVTFFGNKAVWFFLAQKIVTNLETVTDRSEIPRNLHRQWLKLSKTSVHLILATLPFHSCHNFEMLFCVYIPYLNFSLDTQET